MSKIDQPQIDALCKALEGMEVDSAMRERIAADPASIKLSEVGLDSKDLLLLDFHLEEIAGMNIKFDSINDEMSVADLLSELTEVGA